AVVNAGSRLVQLDTSPTFTVPPFPRPAATGTLSGPVVAVPPSPFDLTVDAGGGPRSFTVTYAGTLDMPALRPLIETALRGTSALPGVTSAAERSLLAGATVRLIGRGTAASPFRLLIQGGRGGNAYNPAATLTI